MCASVISHGDRLVPELLDEAVGLLVCVYRPAFVRYRKVKLYREAFQRESSSK